MMMQPRPPDSPLRTADTNTGQQHVAENRVAHEAAVRMAVVTMLRRPTPDTFPGGFGGDPSEDPNATFHIQKTVGKGSQVVVADTAALRAALGKLRMAYGTPDFVGTVTANCLAQRPEHVTGWRSDALGVYARHYFSFREAQDALPTLFTGYDEIHSAVAELVQRNAPAGDLRILELAAGKSSWARWNALAQGRPHEKLEAIVTDCNCPEIGPRPNGISANFSCRPEALDMLIALPNLPHASRFNCALAFYGFDSVWFPKDLAVVKHGSAGWYQVLHRIAVPDWHPKRAAMIRAFSHSEYTGLVAEDFRLLIIERQLTAYDIDKNPELAEAAKARSLCADEIELVVPLGLVNFIEELFERQLLDDGFVLIGDFGPNDLARARLLDYLVFDPAMRCKPVDFDLAAALLRSRGFGVEITPLAALIPTTSALRETVATKSETHLMVVRGRNRRHAGAESLRSAPEQSQDAKPPLGVS